MQWEDMTVRKDTKGYDSTNGYDELRVVRNDMEGYDAYKSMMSSYEWYKGYEKGHENISTVVAHRISTGIKYQKQNGIWSMMETEREETD